MSSSLVQSFSAGPHCRICGPGSLRETSFTNVFVYPKKYYRVTPFSHPRDRQFEGTKMWTFVTCLDKLVEKKVGQVYRRHKIGPGRCGVVSAEYCCNAIVDAMRTNFAC